ncbi:MAG TPA: electron transfer flavoprotein subunit alpha/FixB family protein [Streptosporangiaceae bacterium]|nr:electron transfer flavoprotein subunit alpha/FixB family protein [Streptosporangiaceae bacterium]
MSGLVLCLLERDGDGAAAGSLRALGLARSLAGADGRLSAVVFGPQPEAAAGGGLLAEVAAAGASELCVVSADGLSGYAPLAWARALSQLVAGEQAVAVVAAASDRGGEVLAHLGALAGLPVAANCISVSATGAGSWQLVRQRWAGSVLEDAELEASCALLSVATDALPADEAAADPVAAGAVAVRAFVPALEDADLQVCATESAEQSAGVSLATARVVVGGGRGVGGPEGFAALEELAGLLGGVVGVSRVVTSQGWRPHRQQVGQTGTKISPELYLACGISGAIQHMAGCLTAKHIVVVNTDPDAPIISRAEYAVIGDLNEVIPALVTAIKEAGGTGG